MIAAEKCAFLFVNEDEVNQMKLFHTVGLSFALMATSFSPAVFATTDTTVSCKNITQKEVAALFDRWNVSLATLDPAKVTKNYSEDAVLSSTP